MLSNLYIRIAELAVTLLLIAAIIFAWREARNDRAQLQSQLATANQALAVATTRQQDRDGKLNDVLSTIAKEKASPATTEQLLAGIVREAGLPTPLSLQQNPTANIEAGTPTGTKGNQPPSNSLQPNPAPTQSASNTASANSIATQLATASEVKIPATDLRPLYDYMLDCKACQAKLSAAQADLADEKSKTATLTKSRDDAVKAAKGGSILQRTLRAAKWFALGAAAGAIAAKAHH
jgi:hypothetical protein